MGGNRGQGAQEKIGMLTKIVCQQSNGEYTDAYSRRHQDVTPECETAREEALCYDLPCHKALRTHMQITNNP